MIRNETLFYYYNYFICTFIKVVKKISNKDCLYTLLNKKTWSNLKSLLIYWWLLKTDVGKEMQYALTIPPEARSADQIKMVSNF